MVWSALAIVAALGCAPVPAEQDPVVSATEATTPVGTEVDVNGFSWVVEDKLAGMGQPGLYEDLDAELAILRREGITTLVSLTETATDPDSVREAGLHMIHIPVPDMTAPSTRELNRFVQVATDVIDKGEAVGVHCTAGMGRTGTFLAAWFVANGSRPAEAIKTVRDLRPGSIETEEQEQAVFTFWHALHRDHP